MFPPPIFKYNTTYCVHDLGDAAKGPKLSKNPLEVPESVERILRYIRNSNIRDCARLERVNKTFQPFAWNGDELARNGDTRGKLHCYTNN